MLQFVYKALVDISKPNYLLILKSKTKGQEYFGHKTSPLQNMATARDPPQKTAEATKSRSGLGLLTENPPRKGML